MIDPCGKEYLITWSSEKSPSIDTLVMYFRHVKKDHEDSFVIIKGAEEIIFNFKEGSFSTVVTLVRRLKGLTKVIAVHMVHNLT